MGESANPIDYFNIKKLNDNKFNLYKNSSFFLLSFTAIYVSVILI